MSSNSFLNDQLSKKTSIFGLKLWIVLGVGVGAFILLMLFFISLWLASRRRSGRASSYKFPHTIPIISKEIQEVKLDRIGGPYVPPPGFPLPNPDLSGGQDSEKTITHVGIVSDGDAEKVAFQPREVYKVGSRGGFLPDYEETKAELQAFLPREGEELHRQEKVYAEKFVVGKQVGSPILDWQDVVNSPITPEKLRGSVTSVLGEALLDDSREKSTFGTANSPSTELSVFTFTEVSNLGWGQWYSLKDLADATESFSESNVLGEGGYGIVYKGLIDGTVIAVKNLLNNRGQAEKEFKVEVEAIGRARHKNLVRLIGYCAEGNYRMLVYEYVDNGNLEQWLHGPSSKSSSLSWEARMNIVLGTAKALTYLHEALEPKVVHRDIKASNILIDSQYNAKVSDFGLAKLLGSGKSHVTTRVMGTFGYVAPEYCNTGMLNERSDVYSFGVLLMEVITGRDPVDYNRPPGEVNLVDWLKLMVGTRRSEDVADPSLEVKPSTKALKRTLLVALRCVDPDASKRPEMGHVVHMLEAEDFPFRDVRTSFKNPLRFH
ncbi:hypothetical protein O6H91_07G017200 [Diphasiastrum complanatum]|uniref:Uncharacterized protein n=1 Tax=Diphasiastrum complanatum TaxID=34168 RepID=A0ACC2D355_DIPCM|nr:hypothetical protein O6H91_07G017200 [Diphasiastrum complanatum]